jgi:predicted regulator of Ras-like GTPase activity (Roadblock/LC7/MglB family)
MSEAAAILDRLIKGLCEAVPQIRQAVVVSSDGLPLARSDGLGRDSADRLAAIASGMIGLAYGSAGQFGAGAVSNVIIEMENGWLFVTGIRGGSLICCLTEKEVDMSTVAFEMSIFVQRVGETLTPDVRYELKTQLLDAV